VTPSVLRFAPQLSRGRRHPEPPHAYRNCFQRDRDRIIHSRAFRRLEEVFVILERTELPGPDEFSIQNEELWAGAPQPQPQPGPAPRKPDVQPRQSGPAAQEPAER